MQCLQVYINRNLLNSWAGPSAKLNYGRGLWPCCRPPSVYVRSMCNSRFYIRQFLLAGWLAGRLAGRLVGWLEQFSINFNWFLTIWLILINVRYFVNLVWFVISAYIFYNWFVCESLGHFPLDVRQRRHVRSIVSKRNEFLIFQNMDPGIPH